METTSDQSARANPATLVGVSVPSPPHRRVLRAAVRAVKASGAVVELQDGTKAWLPANEMYANFKTHEDFCGRGRDLVGMSIDVVEFDSAFGDARRLVSHVRVENDPWDSVSMWEDGVVKVMEVTATTKSRAIGLIPPGVRAEIELETLDDLLPSSWGSFARPMVGDEVMGLFRTSSILANKRIVVLDMATCIRNWTSACNVIRLTALDEGITKPSSPTVSLRSNTARYKPPDVPLAAIHHILFVDDDTTFRDSVCDFLEERGCLVTRCGTKQEAFEAILNRDTEFDLAIIDVHLTLAGDFSGLEVAVRLQMEQSRCPIVLTSGVDLDRDSIPPGAKDLRIHYFAWKPFGHDELHHALATVHSDSVPLADCLPGGPPHIGQVTDHQAPSDDREFEDVAYRLRLALDAEAIVLFSIDPVSFAVGIHSSSDPLGLVAFVHPNLDRSPIYDVAIRGETVIASNAPSMREFPKHRYLFRAYGYRSCIGVPVRLGSASLAAYSLFAFHRRPHAFRDCNVQAVVNAARELSYLLRISKLENELRQIKPFEMMGKVYGSMAHDLKRSLSAEFILDKLATAIDCMSGTVDKERIERSLVQLSDRIQRASSIVATFRNMAKGIRTDVETFAVYPELEAIVSQLRDEAEQFGVQVDLAAYDGPQWVVRMRRSGLHQLIYNLLLNAVQQLDRLGTLRQQRVVIVEVQTREDDAGHSLVVLMNDNGPGIHRCDFDRVFEMHFTTKTDGCGMGLSICREIAEDVCLGTRRGSLRVYRSVLLGGTSFELKLPVIESCVA